jgi:TPR repeat protein
MLFSNWKSAGRLIALAAMLCLSGNVAAQSVQEAENDLSIPASEAFGQSLTKQERSEWINRKVYSAEEWERAEKAVAANLDACDDGDAQSCKNAGDAYVSGDGVWPVSAIAYILFKEACDGGVGSGCRAFVELANSGSGLPEGGYDEIEGLIERACDLGDLVACDKFAAELEGPEADPAQLARAGAILEKACAAGGEQACLSLGSRLIASGRPEDHERTTIMWDAMCREGSVAACQAMIEVEQAQPEPDAWRLSQYEYLACTFASGDECIALARRIYDGNGVARDRDLALHYFDRACALGPEACETAELARTLPVLRNACTPDDADACILLARALQSDASPERDSEAALSMFQSACREGLGDACDDAATVIAGRYHPLASARLAAISEWLEKGCDAGYLRACFNLAQALTETDELRAAELYSQTCDAGMIEGCDRIIRYSGPDVPGIPAPLPVLANATGEARIAFDLEICFTQSETFRGKTYAEFQCPRTEKGINSNRAGRQEAPWQALLWRPQTLNGISLGLSGRVLCGGSLIATGWVLTAAHCLTDNETKVATAGHRIRLGVFNPMADEGISYPILRAIPHPQYDRQNNLVFDVALIQFDASAGRVGRARDPDSVRRRKAIAPASLDTLDVGQRRIVRGMPAYSYGWGWTETKGSKSTNYLQIIIMEIMSEQACTAQTKFTGEFRDAALCVGGRNGQQACYGDSGGPLVQFGNRGAQAVLIGVVSAGVRIKDKTCGETGLPSQYTRVAKVRDWIEKYVEDVR